MSWTSYIVLENQSQSHQARAGKILLNFDDFSYFYGFFFVKITANQRIDEYKWII